MSSIRLLRSLTSSLIFLFIFPSAIWANTEMAETMAEYAIRGMKAQGNLQAMAKCSGLSEKKLEDSIRSGIMACAQHIENDAALDQCTEKEMMKRTGINRSTIAECDQSLSQDDEREAQLDAYDQEIESIYDAMGDNEPTPAQQQRLDELHQAMMQENMKAVKNAIELSSAASQDTLDEITLPIYKNSTVMMHLQNPEGFFGKDKKTSHKILPAATFQSPDSSDKILAYYKKALPDFEIATIDDGVIVLMEGMPKDFDLLQHFQELQSQPHILITPEKNNPTLKSETQSTIEIGYQPIK